MHRPADTSTDAHERQLEAIRQMTPEARLAAAVSMSEDVRRLVEAGVRSRHPGLDPDDVPAEVAAVLLGPDLAREVRRRRTTQAR